MKFKSPKPGFSQETGLFYWPRPLAQASSGRRSPATERCATVVDNQRRKSGIWPARRV